MKDSGWPVPSVPKTQQTTGGIRNHKRTYSKDSKQAITGPGTVVTKLRERAGPAGPAEGSISHIPRLFRARSPATGAEREGGLGSRPQAAAGSCTTPTRAQAEHTQGLCAREGQRPGDCGLWAPLKGTPMGQVQITPASRGCSGAGSGWPQLSPHPYLLSSGLYTRLHS